MFTLLPNPRRHALFVGRMGGVVTVDSQVMRETFLVASLAPSQYDRWVGVRGDDNAAVRNLSTVLNKQKHPGVNFFLSSFETSECYFIVTFRESWAAARGWLFCAFRVFLL